MNIFQKKRRFSKITETGKVMESPNSNLSKRYFSPKAKIFKFPNGYRNVSGNKTVDRTKFVVCKIELQFQGQIEVVI